MIGHRNALSRLHEGVKFSPRFGQKDGKWFIILGFGNLTRV